MSDIHEFKKKYIKFNMTANDWFNISEKAKLTDEIIDIYEKNLNWYSMSKYQNLSNYIIENYADKINWEALSSNPNFSEGFMEKFQDKLDWNVVSERSDLSEEFIKQFQDKLDLNIVSRYSTLSEKFIEEFQDKLNWERIEKHQDKLDWNALSWNDNLSEEFIEKFQDKLDWKSISSRRNLSEDFIEKFQDKLDLDVISRYSTLSEEFIEKFQDKLDWESISSNDNISLDILNKFPDKIDYTSVSLFRSDLTTEYLDKNVDKINWFIISENKNGPFPLPESFLEKHKDTIDFHRILLRQDLSDQFILSNSDKFNIKELETSLIGYSSKAFDRRFKAAQLIENGKPLPKEEYVFIFSKKQAEAHAENLIENNDRRLTHLNTVLINNSEHIYTNIVRKNEFDSNKDYFLNEQLDDAIIIGTGTIDSIYKRDNIICENHLQNKTNISEIPEEDARISNFIPESSLGLNIENLNTKYGNNKNNRSQSSNPSSRKHNQ